MKKQTIFARSVESLESLRGPETIITRHLVEVSRSVGGIQYYVGALYELNQPAPVETGHYYQTGWPEYLMHLGDSAVQPVAQPVLRAVENVPRTRTIPGDEVIIGQRLLDQLQSPTNESLESLVPVQSLPIDAPVPVGIVEISAGMTGQQRLLNELRAAALSASIPQGEAHDNIAKAA